MSRLIPLFIALLCLSAAVGANAVPWAADSSPTMLAPVIVTANRMATPAAEVTAAVTVIDAGQVAASGAADLGALLRDVAGIQITSNGPQGSLATASLRGSESGQVLVLLDGIRLNSQQNGIFDLSTLPIPLSSIERIEIVHGPASTLYGSSAVGGVIQIFTKQPTARPTVGLDLSAGSNEVRAGGLSVARRQGPVGYALTAAQDHSGGYRPNADFDQTRLNGRFSLDLPADFYLRLATYRSQKEIGVPGAVSYPSPNARQKDTDNFLSLALEGPAGPWLLTVRGVYTRRHEHYIDPDWGSDERYLTQTRGMEAQGEVEFGSQRLVLGGEAYSDSLASEATGKREQTRWAGFLQETIRLPARVLLELGLRYDAHSDFADEASPRLALVLPVSDSTRVRLSAGRSYRAPTLNDRFYSDTWSQGNPNLKPETAWEYELGVEQQLGRKGTLSLAAFRREARDLIQWQADQNYVWSPQNLARARIWGGEANFDYHLFEKIGLGAGYTYLLPRDLTNGGIVANKARHALSGRLDLGPWRHTRLELIGRFVEFYPQAGRTCSGYAVFDAVLDHAFSLRRAKDLDLTLAVRNLFDRDYQVNPGYPMPPRTLAADLNLHF